MDTKKEKINKIRESARGSEIILGETTYKIDLMRALNFYNMEHSDKDKKSWLLSHISKTDKKLAKQLNCIEESKFRYIGILARLKDIGSFFKPNEITYFNNKLLELQEMKPSGTSEVIKAVKLNNVVSIQTRMLDKAKLIACEFDVAIDEFILNDVKFDPKVILKSFNTKSQILKLVSKMYVNSVEELREAVEGTDEQLVESYSHMSKAKIKKLISLYDAIIETCSIQSRVVGAIRLPRKRKDKPAGVIVSKMRYMKESLGLGLNSISAPTIINSQELWVFNTKKNTLQVYRADGPKGLSVRGSKIVGYNIENSNHKKLRIPELVKDYVEMNKRTLSSTYNALKTKIKPVTGTISDQCILLKVF